MKKIIIVACTAVITLLFILLIRATIDVLNIPTSYRPTVKYLTIIDRKLSTMTLREKVASQFIFHKAGYDINTLKNYLEQYNPSGLIFMSNNIPPSDEELANLTSSLQTDKNFPYLFAIDEEGGVVTRLGSDNYQSAYQLKNLPDNETTNAFKLRSELLKQVGMSLNFGIVADITFDPNSFIYSRVFGGDPNIVANKMTAAVNGAKDLTYSTLKHYPGHGETDSDSHFSVPNTNIGYDTWLVQDDVPFKAGIAAGAEFVMFGHLIYSAVDDKPATLSKKWHDIIKTNDKFNGITITDDMVMLQQTDLAVYANPIQNAIDAINAGNTMLLFVLDHGAGYSQIDPDILIDGVVNAVNNNEIEISTINNNARKILQVRAELAE